MPRRHPQRVPRHHRGGQFPVPSVEGGAEFQARLAELVDAVRQDIAQRQVVDDLAAWERELER